ncbi:DUF1161 domain-containing protein [Sinimarinibacterium sp. NLF-5-8]|uniref:DUF1161 domain-containing protein n=1 Tax=Sinimarinibacterium sp. NLF-5-8 TaxID=2698684 RepID=UPI00137C24E9|nr:DUF1161 domain-containing protein [Sinimarinibacterium sp. NLF-5-8]QHS10205.1 DUF1161 domain-containing protein [Sinimarinibacterium sp. NLF-5-8]
MNLGRIGGLMAVLSGLLLPLAAQATAPQGQVLACAILKAQIAETLEAKGVRDYQLDVIPVAGVRAGHRVVGRCEGGQKRIIYRRGQQV